MVEVPHRKYSKHESSSETAGKNSKSVYLHCRYNCQAFSNIYQLEGGGHEDISTHPTTPPVSVWIPSTVAANKKFPFRFRGTVVQRFAVDKKTVIYPYRFLSTAKRCTGVPRKRNGNFLLAATVAVLMYQAIVTFVDTGHTIIKYCTCTYDKKIKAALYFLNMICRSTFHLCWGVERTGRQFTVAQ